jgi:hypothetical protein
MITEEAFVSYNARLTVDLSNLKKLTPQQRDRVRQYGSQAEVLLKNPDLALMIHHYKFEVLDALSNINGHGSDDNTRRVALTNNLAGMDGFVASLKRAVSLRNRLQQIEQDQTQQKAQI